jgi:tyrosyl-tRNA synthetase
MGVNKNQGGQSIENKDKIENISDKSVSTTVPPLETTLAPILEAYKKCEIDPEFTNYELVAQ